MGDADLGELPGAGQPTFRLTAKTCPECLGQKRYRVKTYGSDSGWLTCGYCWGAGEIEVQRVPRPHP